MAGSRGAKSSMQRSSWLGINPSQLRHQVEIQTQIPVANTTGALTGGPWSTIRTCFARITMAMAREDYQSDQFSAQVTHIITVRCVESPPIAPGMRVVFGAHIYLIQTVDNVELRNILLNLMCLEINGGQ